MYLLCRFKHIEHWIHDKHQETQHFVSGIYHMSNKIFCLSRIMCTRRISDLRGFHLRWYSSALVTRLNIYTLYFAYIYFKGASGGSRISSNWSVPTDLRLHTKSYPSYINAKFRKHQPQTINSTYLQGYHLGPLLLTWFNFNPSMYK